jgi:hypothetical protein
MSGAVIMIIALVIVIPVLVIMSGAVAAAALGWGLKTEVDAEHEGSELLEIS